LAFCGWNASPWGYGVYGWTVVHTRRIVCDDDYYYQHHRYYAGFGPRYYGPQYYGPRLYGPPRPHVWGPGSRPVVVVRVNDGDRAARLARERAREKSRELASRHTGDEHVE